MKVTAEATRLDLVGALVDVAGADSEYCDVYLRRGRTILEPIMSRKALDAFRQQRGRLPALRDDVARSLEVGDWHRVRELATTLRDIERELAVTNSLIVVAERVYETDAGIGPRVLAARAVSPIPASELRGVQARTVSQLGQLASLDTDLRTFYLARRAAVEAFAIEDQPGAAGAVNETLRKQAREALTAGQWEALASLAARFGGGTREEGEGGCACGPLPDVPARPDDAAPAAEAATALGLEPVHLEARDDLRAFLSCRCSMAPSIPDQARDPEEQRKPSSPCACAERCPALAESLRENLDFVKHTGLLTSLGTRYLPVFRKESVLLETFPEGTSDRGPLLERLGLPRRLGLSRCEIERALLQNGGDVIQSVDLDPLQYILIPVPFDVYLRAAGRYGWGESPQWTHLDGYQVLRGWRLRALVGGNARFGGPSDLCSIGRDDPREGVQARFCIVRRDRSQERVGILSA